MDEEEQREVIRGAVIRAFPGLSPAFIERRVEVYMKRIEPVLRSFENEETVDEPPC